MSPLAKHERNKRWLRIAAFAAVVFGGALFIINEMRAPRLYLVAFVFFQIAMFALIGIGLVDWRQTKKHGIIDHGATESPNPTTDKVIP